MANDQVIDTFEDYFAGRITAEQAIGQLRFAKLMPIGLRIYELMLMK